MFLLHSAHSSLFGGQVNIVFPFHSAHSSLFGGQVNKVSGGQESQQVLLEAQAGMQLLY